MSVSVNDTHLFEQIWWHFNEICQTLYFQDPKPEDGGVYKCTASNENGESNANITLNFSGKKSKDLLYEEKIKVNSLEIFKNFICHSISDFKFKLH